MFSGAPAYSNEVSFILHAQSTGEYSGAPSFSNLVTFNLHVNPSSSITAMQSFIGSLLNRWFRLSRSFF